MEVINIENKLSKFSEQWTPKIIAELNNQHVKLAKLQGEFVWHNHEHEDELFFVVKGQLTIEFRDRTVVLNPGEMIVVEKGVDHKPIAEKEVEILLFEPAKIKHTGNVQHEITKDELEWI